MLSVMPSAWIIAKDMSMEKGIARATKKELRKPRKRKSTEITRSRPVRMLFSSSETMLRMSLDWLRVTESSTPSGNNGLAYSSRAKTRSVSSMIFSPVRFLTARVTLGLPLRRA